MDKKAERIVKRVERAGIRKAKHLHHLPSEDELLSLRIQTLSLGFRLGLAFGGFLSGLVSYFLWRADLALWSSVMGIVALFLVLFAIFGIRRTLETVLDSISNSVDIVEILSSAKDGIADSVPFFDV